MKILHTVEFYNPSVGGSQEVVKQLSEHLVMLGHEVTVATTKLPHRPKKIINGVKIVEFAISGNQVRGISGEIEKYRKFLIEGKFDVILNYAAQQWATDIFFEVIDKVKAKKILVPCGFSGLYDPAYKNYFKKLPEILKKYDATVYLSKDYRDINFAQKHHLKNIYLIPNGADEREFTGQSEKSQKIIKQQLGIPDANLLIINISNHTGVKGHREAIKAFQASRINNATLLFIGDINLHAGCYKSCRRSARWQNNLVSKITMNNKQILVTTLDRSQTLKVFQAADLFLFLSNLECSPLVLFESAAAGIPFIASSCGNAKEIARWTGSGLIAKSYQQKNGYTKTDISDAALKIEELAHDNNKRLKMGAKGKKAWQKHFSWNTISRQYENLYHQVLKK